MQQQQVVVVGAKPQGGLSWIYNDLPLSKFKVLGIIQIIIGSIYLIVNALFSTSGGSNYYDYALGITILGSGAAAMWTVQRRDKMLVTGTGLLALIAAILTGIVIGLTVIYLILLVLGSIAGHDSSDWSSSHDHQEEDNTLSVIIVVLLGFSFLFQVTELIVSIILALTTKRILDHLQPVAPFAAAPVTFEKV